MIVAIDSNGPMIPSGYGKQAYLLGLGLRAAGHKVVYFAFNGASGRDTTYDGFTVYPSGSLKFGLDVTVPHILRARPDLVVFLMDYYQLEPAAPMMRAAAEQVGATLAAWLPIDGDRLAPKDRRTIDTSRAHPIAMSEHGAQVLDRAGFDYSVIPHAVDLSTYKVLSEADRKSIRSDMGLDDKFVIGIVSANADAVRKCFPEQLRAFANFAKRHDDARLILHTLGAPPNGLNLYEIVEDFELEGRVMMGEQYPQIAGLMNESDMAELYNVFDLLSICSMGEGFGIPALEANACGTPVVCTDCSALTEHGSRRHNYLVSGQEFWNPVLRVSWVRPDIDRIGRAYVNAYKRGQVDRADVRKQVTQYGVDKVFADWWTPFLNGIEVKS